MRQSPATSCFLLPLSFKKRGEKKRGGGWTWGGKVWMRTRRTLYCRSVWSGICEDGNVIIVLLVFNDGSKSNSCRWVFHKVLIVIKGLRTIKRTRIDLVGLNIIIIMLNAAAADLRTKVKTKSGNSFAATCTYYLTSPVTITLFLNITTWLWRLGCLKVFAQHKSMQSLFFRKWRCELHPRKRQQKDIKENHFNMYVQIQNHGGFEGNTIR